MDRKATRFAYALVPIFCGVIAGTAIDVDHFRFVVEVHDYEVCARAVFTGGRVFHIPALVWSGCVFIALCAQFAGLWGVGVVLSARAVFSKIMTSKAGFLPKKCTY